MRTSPKEILLWDARRAIFRCPELSDAKDLIEYLDVTSRETPFLLNEAGEVDITPEAEEAFIQRTLDYESIPMLQCIVDGNLAGNCRLQRMDQRKTWHRASIGIALYQKFWGLGIGTAMVSELIRIAEDWGVTQLELDYVEGNDRALGLYQKIGFKAAAEHPNAIRMSDGTVRSEIFMIRSI